MALDKVYAPRFHREVASTGRVYKVSVNIKYSVKEGIPQFIIEKSQRWLSPRMSHPS